MARALMIQGTGSDVGKSLVVAGLARACVRRGLKVVPFKPQNMSTNAAVTVDGGEIGRAQALQARAAFIEPSVHLNPVLLKPQTDIGAQVIVQGRVHGTADARSFQSLKRTLMPAIAESFRTVATGADLVLVEGAGSPAETNLRENDIANMGFARAFGIPVVIVGDIDRGGVIASLVGTHAVLDDGDRAMIRGFLINKFRGDVSLFRDGIGAIERRTGWRCFGVLPFVTGLVLPAEDGVQRAVPSAAGRVHIAVPLLSRIANTDDFEPLQLEPQVRFSYVPPGTPLPRDANLIILPGSKATISDLRFLKSQGWDIDIRAHVRQGGFVLGLCAGLQMLGRQVSDPAGVEGVAGTEDGLGLLDIQTELSGEKVLREVRGTSVRDGSAAFAGYEMHVGRTTGAALAKPLLRFADGRLDGAVSDDDRIAGCYVHGLFAHDAFRAGFLAQFRVRAELNYEAHVEESLDRLAREMEQHLDLTGLLAVAGEIRS